ncbi:hypothetical protein [Bradyrhizobium sp. URHC0002]
MKRPFEESDIAERPPEPRRVRVALRTAALTRQQHDRKIRPRRLTVEPVHEVTQICGLDCFVGEHGKTGATLDLTHQRGEIAADFRVVAGLSDQGSGNRCVAALRREDDGPLG